MTTYFCSYCKTTDHWVKDVCPLIGTCYFCKSRPATLHFGDSLSFTHGGMDNCCELCAAEMQLDFAKEMAAEIPQRQAEVDRLREEDER